MTSSSRDRSPRLPFSRRAALAGAAATGLASATLAAAPARAEGGGETRIQDVPLAGAPRAAGGPSATRQLSVPGATMIGCTWAATTAAPASITARGRLRATGAWGPWLTLEPLQASQEEGAAVHGTQAVWLGGPVTEILVCARSGSRDETAGLTAHVITTAARSVDRATVTAARRPADSRLSASARSYATASTGSATAPQTVVPGPGAPRIMTRAGWGADESMVRGKATYASELLAGVVHHTEDSNTYTAADVPAMLRGHLRYHTQVHGWRDLGYNLLIDRFGTVYEGRAGGLTRHVVGAHATGSNTGTVGVAMIGSTMSTDPSAAMLEALADVMAWKLGGVGVRDVDATVTVDKKSQPRVFGHRDARSVDTDCPGDRGESSLTKLRALVATRLAQAPSPVLDRAQVEGGREIIGTVTRLEEPRDTSFVTTFSSGLQIVRSASGALRLEDPDFTGQVERIGGADRYAVSAAASARAYPAGARTVYIASGQVYTDALAAGPAAAAVGAPLLLTSPTAVPAAVAAELRRLRPSTVVIVGGPGTVDERVAASLRTLTGATVRRIAGADRYTTAAAVARDGVPLFLASGEVFSDAISASGVAGVQGGSVLLTRQGALPASTAAVIARNAGQKVWVLGGPTTVSEAVLDAITALGATPVRLGGIDRYAVSAAGAATVAPRGADTMIVASGETFPDALSAATLTGALRVPILLTRRTTLSARALLELRKAPTSRVVLVGGEATISPDVLATA